MTGEALVRSALEAIEQGDLEAFLACLDDDLVLEIPYTDGAPTDKQGLAGLIGYLLKTFATRTFGVDAVHPVAGADQLVIEYHSDFAAHVDGIRYTNRYVGIFDFRDGLISRWVEYANPVPFNEVMEAIASHGRDS
ncbi:MAG: nuclear transport factor 2 family protein [Actinobacteria bacterium]|nr:nuclear transport factor 2 family protein [Actinomycetota bacterium]